MKWIWWIVKMKVKMDGNMRETWWKHEMGNRLEQWKMKMNEKKNGKMNGKMNGTWNGKMKNEDEWENIWWDGGEMVEMVD